MSPRIVTASGVWIDLPDPKPGQIELDDVARHLSRLVRFVGAGSRFYSVAQHSVCVAYTACAVQEAQATVENAKFNFGQTLREGLGHDGHEFILNDPPGPVKLLLGSQYKQIETRIDTAVRRDLDLGPFMPDCVRMADKIMLAVEAELMAPAMLELFDIPPRALEYKATMESGWWTVAKEMVAEEWTAEESYRAFLREWEQSYEDYNNDTIEEHRNVPLC